MKTIAEKKKKFTHFKYEERLVLEFYLKGTNLFPRITDTGELAAIFHKKPAKYSKGEKKRNDRT